MYVASMRVKSCFDICLLTVQFGESVNVRTILLQPMVPRLSDIERLESICTVHKQHRIKLMRKLNRAQTLNSQNEHEFIVIDTIATV